MEDRHAGASWRRWASFGAAALAVLTVLVPIWLEKFVGVSPDGGDGSMEVLIAAAAGIFALLSGGFGVSAYRFWRREQQQARSAH